MDYKDEAIGVLGDAPQRSAMDKQMQAEFGGSLELYVASGIGVVGPQDFGQRSTMDKRLQAEFNPYYKNSPSVNGEMTATPNRQYCISPGNCVPIENYRERYCGAAGASANVRLAPKGIASVNPQPSNPLNGKVGYIPLR